MQILIDDYVYTEDAKEAAANACEATAYVREAAAWGANSVVLEYGWLIWIIWMQPKNPSAADEEDYEL